VYRVRIYYRVLPIYNIIPYTNTHLSTIIICKHLKTCDQIICYRTPFKYEIDSVTRRTRAVHDTGAHRYGHSGFFLRSSGGEEEEEEEEEDEDEVDDDYDYCVRDKLI